MPSRNNLPPAIILPEKLIHRTRRVIPGQFAGAIGNQHEPFFLNVSRFNAQSYGAWPHARGGENPAEVAFHLPNLSVPEGMEPRRFNNRMHFLKSIASQRAYLDQFAEVESFDRYQQQAISLLVDGKMKDVFDVTKADDKTQE